MSNHQEGFRQNEVSKVAASDALSHLNRRDLLRGHADMNQTAHPEPTTDAHAQGMLNGFTLTDNAQKAGGAGNVAQGIERAIDTLKNHHGTESHAQHQFFGAQHDRMHGSWGGYKVEGRHIYNNQEQAPNFYQNNGGRPGPNLIQSIGTTVDTANHHMTSQSHVYGGNNFHSFLKRN